MIKILFAADGINMEQEAFSFIRELNRETPVYLYGVFLPKRSLRYWLLRAGSLFLLPPYDDRTQQQLIVAPARFAALYNKYRNKHSSCWGRGETPVLKLKKESRYADLLVIGYAVLPV
ncbi:hypothetical protein [Niabella drilacis]|uniref:Uncharacterized protein n=1 Tax=Niabella drilacis (strain DSM 25811 / CCM 8410 / CCUG 62505 / LMG 26954 / E90) TaxID=1285928 RepID=A0A1G6RFB2_NIADE|nr:hypothetical protein [Niabella drilacis]SDD02735.1 hypothetical protein SAMN04487894_105246 [Niabella drilacis]